MRHLTALIGSLFCALLAAGCGKIGGSVPIADASHSWQTIGKYCVDCHNRDDLAADIAFDKMTPESVAREPKIFESAVRKLRGRMMPPPGKAQPDQPAIDGLVIWLETTLDKAAEQTVNPGQIALPRLNRKEYANAVRDVLALDVDPNALLPEDDQLKGFDNVADALQVSPSFIEQYVSAARTVAVQAVGRPNVRPGSKTYHTAPGTPNTHISGLPLGTRGGVVAEHYFPSDGEYEVNIADMAQALWVDDMEFENPVIVTLDGERMYQTVIGGEADMKSIDQDQDPAVTAINARLKNIRFKSTSGPHKVGVTFLRRTAAESDNRLQMFLPGGGQDHVLRVSSFQISGPYNPTGLSLTPSRERIFRCYPKGEAEQLPCAEKIVSSIGSRAYRRPLTELDIRDIMEYYRDGLKSGGFEEGIRSAITGILASPFFLYRAEHVPRDLTAGQRYRIDGMDLASKLSFFLWNTVPDDELLKLAIDGKLNDPAVRKQQVQRLLADPRADTLASNFAYQWLHLQRLEEVQPDRGIFPYASGGGDPRNEYVTETTLFVNSIFRENRNIVDLLSAKHTYLNERLALLYGVSGVKGDRFRRVELDNSVRWGLLGKGAVLMGTAYPNRTSPVLRGSFVLENIIGTPPSPPPANVPPFPEKDVGTAKAKTVRDIMAQHRANPVCFSCHGIMDPLGFSLENFDAVGVWRDRDRFAGTAIDASGELADGRKVRGPDDLRNALLSKPDQFVQTFTERLLQYALGRTVEYYDMPAVRKIVRTAKADDYRFQALIWAIVESDPFQMRTVAEDHGNPAPPETTAQNAHD